MKSTSFKGFVIVSNLNRDSWSNKVKNENLLRRTFIEGSLTGLRNPNFAGEGPRIGRGGPMDRPLSD